jgi:hypothetical protein
MTVSTRTPKCRGPIIAWLAAAMAVGLLGSLLTAGPADAATPQPPPQVQAAISVAAAQVTEAATQQATHAKVVAMKASKPARCAGRIVKRKDVKYSRHGRAYAELIVYHSKASHGKECAVVNNLGKYRGLSKKHRRIISVYMCAKSRYGSVCAGGGSAFVDDTGRFKYQAGPVQLRGINGHSVHVFAYSLSPRAWGADSFPQATYDRHWPRR